MGSTTFKKSVTSLVWFLRSFFAGKLRKTFLCGPTVSVGWKKNLYTAESLEKNLLPLGYNSRHKGHKAEQDSAPKQALIKQREKKNVLPATFHTLWLLNHFKLKLSLSHPKFKMIIQAPSLCSPWCLNTLKEATRDQE